MASIRLNDNTRHCLFLSLALMVIVLCSLLLDSASAAGGSSAGGGGGGRGSGGSYNYGSYGSLGPAAGIAGAGGPSMGSGGLSMRRGIYGPVGLGNPHDPQRYGGAGGPTAAQQSAAPTKAGGHHRLSAWGIITIVTFVILIGAGAYWGFICYPFFCKKERNYNMMMNMSSATTATPSTRSTEFEKLDHCCSKSTTSTRSNDTGISNI